MDKVNMAVAGEKLGEYARKDYFQVGAGNELITINYLLPRLELAVWELKNRRETLGAALSKRLAEDELITQK